MNNSDPIVIVGSARTPIGSFQGQLSSFKSPELGAVAIQAAIKRSGVDPAQIEEVIMGCVLSAGVGQAPARQAAMIANLPKKVNCLTINKVCGSGMKSIMLASDALTVDPNIKFMVAGGMESMSNSSYLLDKARVGYRIGHGNIKDHMFVDGLEDAYNPGKLMGYFAEKTATKYNFTREAQDHFALTSLQRAINTRDQGGFETNVEIIPIEHRNKKGEPIIIKQDEQMSIVDLKKIPLLKPVFQENGTVTAANASSISDGAAAVVLTKLSCANQMNIKPIAKILGYVNFAQEPEWFTTAPVGAIKLLLQKLDLSVNSIDLFEINEAFAVVTMAAMQELNLEHNKVNIHGGACAIGHPLGASGTRIITTLMGALIQHQKKIGVASLCIGGGEATAIAIEIL